MIHVKAAALQGCSPGESWQRIELGMLPLMGIGFPLLSQQLRCSLQGCWAANLQDQCICSQCFHYFHRDLWADDSGKMRQNETLNSG